MPEEKVVKGCPSAVAGTLNRLVTAMFLAERGK